MNDISDLFRSYLKDSISMDFFRKKIMNLTEGTVCATGSNYIHVDHNCPGPFLPHIIPMWQH